MSDLGDMRLRPLLEQDLLRGAPPDGGRAVNSETPADLFFDDDDLGSVLYGRPGRGPTPANVFLVARKALSQLRFAAEDGNHDMVLRVASFLRYDLPALPPDVLDSDLSFLVQLPASQPLSSLAADAGEMLENLRIKAEEGRDLALLVVLAFASHARGSLDEGDRIWRVVSQVWRETTHPDDSLIFIASKAALAHWSLCTGQLSEVCFLLRKLGFDAEADAIFPNMSSDGKPLMLFAPVVNAAIKSLAGCWGNQESMQVSRRRLMIDVINAVVAANVAGRDHPAVAACLNTLVRSLQDNQKHEAAILLGREALRTREKALGPEHPVLAQSLNNLALSLVLSREYSEAEQLLMRAQNLRPSFPNPQYWLARLYGDRSDVGDQVKEIKAWHRYLELGPGSEGRAYEARQRLCRIAA